MRRLSGTYCPLCGCIDLFVSSPKGKQEAHCGPDIETAHTRWFIGQELIDRIYETDVKPESAGKPSKPAQAAHGEED